MIKKMAPDSIAQAKEACFLMVTHEPRGAEEQALSRLGRELLDHYKKWVTGASPGGICEVAVGDAVILGHEKPSRCFFLRCVDDKGDYQTAYLANAIGTLSSIREQTTSQVMKRLMMVGLPGKDNEQRNEAYEDLERWFLNPVAVDTVTLIVLQEEAAGT